MKFQTSNKESTDFEKPHIPEGLYLAELKEVKEIADGTYGKRCAFIYRILEHETDLPMICYTEHKATKENKLGQTLIAHGIELGKEVNTDNLTGSKVRVLVEDYETTEGVKASAISKVKPLSEKVEVKQ